MQRGTGSWNPLPGTIVDRHIGGRTYWEFWLQAHQGLQGTAKPAHYVVIKDDIRFSADEVQGFVHKLSYAFPRATKAVSIVAPVYCAHLLAERARVYLYATMVEGSNGSVYSDSTSEWNGSIHPRLKDSSFYK